METETAEMDAPAVETPRPEEKEDADVDKENSNDIGSKPPENGKCRNCGRERPLNRSRCCYVCFVEENITNDEKKRGREWRPGDSHPDYCDCEGLGEHKNKDGSARGMN